MMRRMRRSNRFRATRSRCREHLSLVSTPTRTLLFLPPVTTPCVWVWTWVIRGTCKACVCILPFKGLLVAPFRHSKSAGTSNRRRCRALWPLRWPAVCSEGRLGCLSLHLPSTLVASGARLARKATLCGPWWSAASAGGPRLAPEFRLREGRSSTGGRPEAAETHSGCSGTGMACTVIA